MTLCVTCDFGVAARGGLRLPVALGVLWVYGCAEALTCPALLPLLAAPGATHAIVELDRLIDDAMSAIHWAMAHANSNSREHTGAEEPHPLPITPTPAAFSCTHDKLPFPEWTSI